MSILTALAIMGLVLAGIVIVCLGVTRMEKTAKTSEYDERQQLVRGRGHRLVNMVGFAYMLLILPELIRQVEGEKNVEAYLLVFGGFMLQNLVFHVYCLLNHAELPLSKKPMVTALGFLMVGIIWLCSFYSAQQRNPLSLVGHGSDGWTYLMVAFTFLAMALMHLLQLLRREKE